MSVSVVIFQLAPLDLLLCYKKVSKVDVADGTSNH